MSGRFGGGGKKCTVCTKTVYPGEMVTYEKRPYHVKCFKCKPCDKKLTPARCQSFEGVIYCEPCYRKGGYAQKSSKVVWKKGASSGATTSSRRFGGGGKKCEICGKTAFLAEQVSFEKKVYHVNCFRCKVCKKKNTPSDTVRDNETGDLYCKKCAASAGVAKKQLSSTKNWKKSSGGGGSSRFGGGGSSRFGGGGKKCEKCGKTAFSAEQVIFEKKVYHPKCFKCDECSKKLTPSQANALKDKLYCGKCFASGGFREQQTKSARTWKATASSTGGSGRSGRYGGGGKKCKVCGKTVFAGEQISFEKEAYHPKCFKCLLCDNKLSTSTANVFQLKTKEHAEKLKIEWEEKDGKRDILICKKCFSEKNVNKMQATQNKWKKTASKSTRDKRFNKFGGGGIKCTVCAKTVYPAELISLEKHPYHTKCFNCRDCKKRLKLGTANHRKYPDGTMDIWCSKCFFSKGYNRADVCTKVPEAEPEAERKAEPEPAPEKPTPEEPIIEPVKSEPEPVKSELTPRDPELSDSEDLSVDEDSGARDTLD